MFAVIAQVETLTNSRAIRFEPATHARLTLTRTDAQKTIINRISEAHRKNSMEISWGTSLMLYACSYGAVQLMGFNLWGPICNYQKTFVDFMECEADQRIMFERFLSAMRLDRFSPEGLAGSPEARHHFAVTYNGAPEYGDRIADALKSFGYIVKG
jgi:hypothetical protein